MQLISFRYVYHGYSHMLLPTYVGEFGTTWESQESSGYWYTREDMIDSINQWPTKIRKLALNAIYLG